jgi:hypothetical protein
LQAVLHPVVDLLDEDVLMLQRLLEPALVALPLDGHAEDVCGTLQEGDVLLAELALGSAIDLQDAVWCTVALQDHIDGAAHAMRRQQLRRSEPFLVFEMIGDHRLSGAQREPRGGFEISADAGGPDKTGVPAEPCAHQQSFLRWHVLQHLA